MSDAEHEARRWLAALAADPELHLHDIDLPRRRATLVRFDEPTLRDAAFLDERALRAATPALTLDLTPTLLAAAEVPLQPLDAIFHVAHCGSTLISRLLGALPRNLPKREPLAWLACGVHARELGRAIAPPAWELMFDATLRLLGRRFHADDRVLLKSTSVAANLIGPFLAREPGQRALLVTTPLEAWLAHMLDAPEHRAMAEHFAPFWALDLAARDAALAPRTLAERVASCWVAPMLHFDRALSAEPSRTRLVVAGDLLEHPRVGLAALAAFLELRADAASIEAVASGPLLRGYSKAPDRPYDATERAARLAAARVTHAAEITAGMAYAERWLGQAPRLAAQLRG